MSNAAIPSSSSVIQNFFSVKLLTSDDIAAKNAIWLSPEDFQKFSINRDAKEVHIYVRIANFIYKALPLKFIKDNQVGIDNVQFDHIKKSLGEKSTEVLVESYFPPPEQEKFDHVTFQVTPLTPASALRLDIAKFFKVLEELEDEILSIGRIFTVKVLSKPYLLEVEECQTQSSIQYGKLMGVNAGKIISKSKDHCLLPVRDTKKDTRYDFFVEPPENYNRLKSIITKCSVIRREIYTHLKGRLLKIGDTCDLKFCRVRLSQVLPSLDSNFLYQIDDEKKVHLAWNPSVILMRRATHLVASEIEFKLLRYSASENDTSKTHKRTSIIALEEINKFLKSDKQSFVKGESFLLDLDSGEFVVEVCQVRNQKVWDTKVKRIPWTLNADTKIVVSASSHLEIHIIENLNPPIVKSVNVIVESKSRYEDKPLTSSPPVVFSKLNAAFSNSLKNDVVVMGNRFVIDSTAEYIMSGLIADLEFEGVRPIPPEGLKLSGKISLIPGKTTKISYMDSEKRKIEDKPNREVKEEDPILALRRMGVGGFPVDTQIQIRDLLSSTGRLSSTFDSFGIKSQKGILLYGPPRTGKTVLAKAMAKLFGAAEENIVLVSAPDLLNKFYGETEANIRNLFEKSMKAWEQGKNEVHVIIIDEIDAISPNRSTLGEHQHTYSTVVTQLLASMDGIRPLHPKTRIIGMTNNRQKCDPAVLGSGRFGEQIEITFPEEQGRLEIFEIHTQGFKEKGKLDPNINFKKFMTATEGWTGASIEQCVNSAARNAVTRLGNKYKEGALTAEQLKDPIGLIGHHDFMDAIKQMTATSFLLQSKHKVRKDENV